MYESFYNLKRGPFDITPDPSFLFSTKRHNEALAALYYGVRWRKGFVVLTGQVGTGKTLLLRCLLAVAQAEQRCRLRICFQQPACAYRVPAIHRQRLRAADGGQKQRRTAV